MNHAIYIACIAFGALIAWKIQDARYYQREAQIIETHLQATKKQAEHYQTQRMETEMARAKLIADLGVKNAQIDDLRDRIDDINIRVRVKPRVCANTGTAADAAGTGNATAELAADARQAYFDLRRGIVETESMLEFCRTELRNRSK